MTAVNEVKMFFKVAGHDPPQGWLYVGQSLVTEGIFLA